jgi:hypothetical protein
MLVGPEIMIKEVAAFGVSRAKIYRSLGPGSYAKRAPAKGGVQRVSGLLRLTTPRS